MNDVVNNLVFSEKEPYEKCFSAHFEKNIKPVIHEIEKLRVEQLALIKKRKPTAIALIAAIVVIGILLIVYLGSFDLAFSDVGKAVFVGGSLLIGLIYNWAFWAPSKKYIENFKDRIIPLIANFYGTYEFYKNQKFSKELLLEVQIVPRYQRYTSGDYLKGAHNEVDFEFAETILEASGRRNGRDIVFKGIFLLIEMNKRFLGEIVVLKDRGKLGNWLHGKFSSYERVSLEDPRFEQKFEVYAESQIEARYVLTTAFMERLLSLEEAYNSKGGKRGVGSLQCRFFDNKVFIMIPSGLNLFEPRSIKETAVHTEDIRIFLSQMQHIFSVIDVLKLYRKTGL